MKRTGHKALLFIFFSVCFVFFDMQAGNVVALNGDNFKKEIASGYVLADFWAPWCAPCRRLSPIMEELSTELSGKVKFVKINVDNSPSVAKEYSIKSLPTLILFKDGKAKRGMIGLRSKEDLLKIITEEIEK